MQQDTLFGEMERPLTQNLYIYCLNNGVNLRDPSGNRSVDSIKSDINRYKDQLASAKSRGAGQFVYDGIQKTIDSLIKELGNELSKPKPKPNPSTKPPKKPDWGDTSNPYNPVNNPNSVGSILSGAYGYWSNGGSSSGSSGGGGTTPNIPEQPTLSQDELKFIDRYKAGALSLFEQEYFNTVIKPKTLVVPGGGYISSPFGNRNIKTEGATRDHKGVDIAGKPRQDILAFEDGVVKKVSIGTNSKRGNYIIIEHVDTNNNKYSTIYQHLHNVSALVGQEVKRGDDIGIQGGGPNDNNPGVQGGSHLHFEIWDKNNNPIDPMTYLSNQIFKKESDFWRSFK